MAVFIKVNDNIDNEDELRVRLLGTGGHARGSLSYGRGRHALCDEAWQRSAPLAISTSFTILAAVEICTV